MATVKQLEANRKNALASTGPQTPEGKGKVARNAVRHGIYSDVPILPGLERAEDWEAHRAGVLQSLAPVGPLEQSLAERVALCVWRMKRVAVYETAVAAVGLEEIAERLRPRPRTRATMRVDQLNEEQEDGLPLPEALGKALKEQQEAWKELETVEQRLRLLERLPEMPDDGPVRGDDAWHCFEDFLAALPGDGELPDMDDPDFLAGLGVPKDELDDPYAWAGWTAGVVRQGLRALAKAGNRTPDKVLTRAIDHWRGSQAEHREAVKAIDQKVKGLRRRLKAKETRLTRERILPDGDTLQKVTRYEAHLSRQMYQALHELQRLQAARNGNGLPPPAALDVTLDASESAEAALEAAGMGNPE
jgi:hypothetical protein